MTPGKGGGKKAKDLVNIVVSGADLQKAKTLLESDAELQCQRSNVS